MIDDMHEIVEDFLIEAFELIEQLDQDLVELEHNPQDLELLNRIFRVAHTIKGSSSFLSFSTLTHLTHNMEDVLNKARRGELKLTPDIMDIILASIDLMKALLINIRNTGADMNSDIKIDKVVEKLQAIVNTQNFEEPQTIQKDISQNDSNDNLVDESAYSDMGEQEIQNEIERLLKERQELDKQKRAKNKLQNTEEKIQTPILNDKKIAQADETSVSKLNAQSQPDENKSPTTSVEQTLRVDVRRLDHLMNLIGELVLGKNRLLKIYGDVEERYDGEKFLEELNQVVSSVSTVTTDLQLAVMKTRMQPVGKVFNKFPRMVRDLSRDLGKNIDLLISGEETELDKSIVEEISDPLVHIIRNSCDHGIEIPEERTKIGKSEVGQVELKAYNEGNHIVIEISDDGKGLDALILKQKAIQKGLISQREADEMTDKEAFGIIFKPGFSTATNISNVSGRGVGMDVVKTNIEKLNGIIEIESEKSKGTLLKLKIPLTLAIIQALLVGAQEEYYAIPLSSVLETVRVSQDEIYTIDGKSVLRLRDEVLSLVRLADIFNVDSVLETVNEVYVVIIGLADQKIGIIVDRLIGQEEVVIKSLGYYLKNIAGIAGATVRGDGRITLIVDVAAIMEMAKNIKVSINKLINESQVTKTKNLPSDYVILAIDDSSTDRAIMKKSLKPLGVTVIEAANGLEGLDIVKNSDELPDAVLVDIEMPRMDGYTFATEVRKYNKYKNIPLIAVTSRSSKTDRMRGVESGMTEYITKPYSAEYLVNVIRRNIKLNTNGASNEQQ